MSLSIVTFTGNAASASASSVDVVDNAAMVANDVRLVCISISNNTITTPTGWTLISNDVIASTRRIYWFWRTHPGAGETTHTFSFSAASNYSMVQFAARGADLTTPVDVITGVNSATSGSTLTSPDRTTVTDGAILLASFHLIANTSTLTLTLPSGMTSIATGAGTGTTGHAYRVAYEARPTAGATGTRSSTANTGSVAWGASALAIRPSTGATVAASATVSGANSVTAGVSWQDQRAAASIAGAAAVTAALTATLFASATLGGACTITAAATVVKQAAASITGTNTVTADASRGQPLAATLGGTNTITASVGPAGFAQLTGTNTVTAAATQTHAASATISGAGSVAVSGPQQEQLVSATVAGTNTITAPAARDQPVTATLGGTLTVTPTGTRVHAARATLTGTNTVTATGVRAVAPTATIRGTLTVTASAVGAAVGVLNPSVWLVDRTSGALTPLPHWTKLTVSPQRNSPGAVSLEYPVAGPQFDTLHDNVDADRDQEVEIWLGGRRKDTLRAILSQTAGDDLDPEATWTFSGHFLEQLLAEAVVFPQAGAPKQELQFSAKTPGQIVATLLSQAQARGALVGMTTDCTATKDSTGVTWPNVVTIKFSPGATYLAVLQRLVDLGLCEFEVTSGRVLRVYSPLGRGVDKTLGATPTIFRRGRNLAEAPVKHSMRESTTTVLAAGSEGVYASASDSDALARRGRRVEGFASANNLTDTTAVTLFATRELAVTSLGQREQTHGLAAVPGTPRPMVDFQVGDWVWSDTRGTLERLRVAQWSLTFDANGPSGTVTLNDLISDWQVRAERKLNAMAQGDAVIGTSQTSTDTVAPNPPTAITLSSGAFSDGGGGYTAVVQVGWTAPNTNVDGTTLTDLAGFRARFQLPALAPGSWTTTTDTGASANSLSISAVPVGVDVTVQVQAFDRDNNASAWSTSATITTDTDHTAPPAPSTPTVQPYLGQLRIRWDGLSNTGAAMPPDLDRTEIHLSQANNFTPTAATLVDTFTSGAGERVATDLTYGVTYYCRLVAVDVAGNTSPASAVANAKPEQVVSQDVFDGAIGSAKLADLAVTTAKINDLAVNDAKIGNCSVGKLTAGTLTAVVTNSGMIRTAAAGRRMEIDSNGWRAYKTDGTTKFAELDISGETMMMVGSYLSGLAGERINLFTDGTQRFYGPSGTDFCEIRNEAASGAQAEPFLRFRGFGNNSTTDSMGNLYLASDNATLTWGNNNWGTEPTAVRLDSANLTTRSPNTVLRTTNTSNKLFLGFRSGANGSDIPGASLWHKHVSGKPLWGAPSQGVGLLFSAGVLYCCDEAGTTGSRRQINASGFIADCTVESKDNIRDLRTSLRGGLRPRDIRLRMRKFQRIEDLAERPDKPGFQIPVRNPDTGREEWVDAEWEHPQRPAQTHVGPIAEELEAIDPDLVWRDPQTGRLGVPLMTVACLALESATEANELIDALSAQVAVLTARLTALSAQVDADVAIEAALPWREVRELEGSRG